MTQLAAHARLRSLRLSVGISCVALFAWCGPILAADNPIETMYSFGAVKGSTPQALLAARDGAIYGIAASGGVHGRGTVFRVERDGTPEVLHAFSGKTDGATPTALIEGKNGTLYGATEAYAQQALDGTIIYTPGTLFALRDRGGLVTLTRAFAVPALTEQFNPNNQGGPMALAVGRDAALYGVTQSDGQGGGTLFRYSKEAGVSILHVFSGAADGSQPNTLILGEDGNLYGTTTQGGSGSGTVFRFAADGTFQTLAALPALTGGATPTSLLWGVDGNLYGGLVASYLSLGVPGAIFEVRPAGGVTLRKNIGMSSTAGGLGPRALVQASDGTFYGTTFGDGALGKGTLFRLTPAGALSTLHAFQGNADGSAPNALALKEDRVATLIGTSLEEIGTVFRWREHSGFESVYQFRYKHDLSPNSLVRGRNGLLYGTTAGSNPDLDAGTVFVITPEGDVHTVHRFTGGLGGANPTSLIEASNGDLYGRTSFSGNSGEGGSIFRITPRGEFTTLYNFTSQGAAAGSPLVEGPDGNFYGTSELNFGLVFRLTPAGAYAVIATIPWNGTFYSPGIGSRLIVGSDAALYGTTRFPAGPHFPDVPGSVFRLTLSGQMTTVVQMEGEPTLQFQGRDGRLYGTTSGHLFLFSPEGAGTIFAVTTSGQLSTLFDFSNGEQGAWPNDLIETKDGQLIGTTLGLISVFGSAADYGSVFRLAPDGILTTLVQFEAMLKQPSGVSVLAQPSSLVEGSHGVFGVTLAGGTASAGSVFKVDTGERGRRH